MNKTEELKPHHYWREDRITARLVVITPDEYEQWGKDNQQSEAYRPAFASAQLPSQGGEAVAPAYWLSMCGGHYAVRKTERDAKRWAVANFGNTPIPLYTHPADQVAEPDTDLVRQCIAQELATWEGDFKGPVHTAMRCLQVRIDAKLASLKGVEE